jgi:hypothetical protein
MVSTEATAKTAPKIQRRQGWVFMLDADTNDNGFPAFAIYKFFKATFGQRTTRTFGVDPS